MHSRSTKLHPGVPPDPIRVVIVDDEVLARRKLRAFAGLASGLEVVAECGTVEAAIAAIQETSPDLVFLDVELGQGLGFDVVAKIGVDSMPLTVFVTGYDHYAIKAFEAQAIDYILKPYDITRFQAVVARARKVLAKAGGPASDAGLAAVLHELRKTRRYPVRFLAKHRREYEVVRVDEILWIGAANNYVTAHTGTREHVIRESISSIAEKLDPRRFLRIQRSVIVNLDRVRAVKPYSGTEYQVIMENGTTHLSGRAYREKVREAFREGF